MYKELYFDIVSDEWAAGLYRIEKEAHKVSFYYHHSLSDLEDENNNVKTVSETYYDSFTDFWRIFLTNNRWFTLHPLYIHPQQRPFIKEELKKVDWEVIADEKWRNMYQRQWNRVLNNPTEYYKPGKSL